MMLRGQRDAAASALSAARNLVVPPTRLSQHASVDNAFQTLLDALNGMVDSADAQAPLSEIEAASERHAAAMQRVSALGEQILEMRVMGPI